MHGGRLISSTSMFIHDYSLNLQVSYSYIWQDTGGHIPTQPVRDVCTLLPVEARRKLAIAIARPV